MPLYDESSTGPVVYLQAQGDARVNGTNAGISSPVMSPDPRSVLPGMFQPTVPAGAYGNMVGAVTAMAQLYPSNPTPVKFADEYEQWQDVSRVTFMPVVGNEAYIQYLGAMDQLTFSKDYPKSSALPTTAQYVANMNQPAQPIGSSDDQILSLLLG